MARHDSPFDGLNVHRNLDAVVKIVQKFVN